MSMDECGFGGKPTESIEGHLRSRCLHEDCRRLGVWFINVQVASFRTGSTANLGDHISCDTHAVADLRKFRKNARRSFPKPKTKLVFTVTEL
jgi:hypothetical protein